MVRTLLGAAALVLVLCGCAHSAAQSPPVPTGGGQPFLPQWYHDLNTPPPTDTACHSQTLQELLVPCDGAP